MKLPWSIPAGSVASLGQTSVAQLALRPTPLLIGGMGGAVAVSSISLMSKSVSPHSEVLPEGMVRSVSSSSIDQECLRSAGP